VIRTSFFYNRGDLKHLQHDYVTADLLSVDYIRGCLLGEMSGVFFVTIYFLLMVLSIVSNLHWSGSGCMLIFTGHLIDAGIGCHGDEWFLWR